MLGLFGVIEELLHGLLSDRLSHFFQLVLKVIIATDVVDLSNNLAHEYFLSDHAHEYEAYADECPI
jgi:hypothetical protein